MAGTLTSPLTTSTPDASRGGEFDFALLWRMTHAQMGALGMNAKQAAESAGVDPSKLSTLRNGGAVSLDNVCRLCSWLQLPMDLFRHRDMSPAARERFEKLVELYASPDDVERRTSGALAGARMSTGQD